MKTKLIILMTICFISCKPNHEKVFTYKKAELSESIKKILDIFITENKLKNDSVEIVINGINGENEFFIQCAEKELIFGDISKFGNYICFYKNFRIIIMYNNIDKRIFNFQNRIANEKIDTESYYFKPSGFGEFPPTYYFKLDKTMISEFYYQNSELSDEIFETIKSIKFQ